METWVANTAEAGGLWQHQMVFGLKTMDTPGGAVTIRTFRQLHALPQKVLNGAHCCKWLDQHNIRRIVADGTIPRLAAQAQLEGLAKRGLNRGEMGAEIRCKETAETANQRNLSS